MLTKHSEPIIFFLFWSATPFGAGCIIAPIWQYISAAVPSFILLYCKFPQLSPSPPISIALPISISLAISIFLDIVVYLPLYEYRSKWKLFKKEKYSEQFAALPLLIKIYKLTSIAMVWGQYSTYATPLVSHLQTTLLSITCEFVLNLALAPLWV